jgi:hypothetical protein
VNVQRPIQFAYITLMLFVVAAQSPPVLADGGSLPVYPHRIISWYHGRYDNKATTSQLQVALTQGFATFFDTPDSGKVVTAWYKARLSGYAEQVSSAGTTFRGRAGIVGVLRYKGKIRVVLQPN